MRKLVISSAIANVFEWYNYVLFGQMALLISEKFFPLVENENRILKGFLLFAIGYIMRPLGGVIFGLIGDKFGRKYALSMSIFAMAIPSCVIALLPTYEDIGVYAIIILCAARIIEGISMGGALTSSMSFLIEHAEENKRGLVGSMIMAGICAGILMGSVVLYLLHILLPEHSFNSWGWRLPFAFGVLIAFAGFYINKFTEDTPTFKQMKAKSQIVASPVSYVIKNYKKKILASIFINAPGSILFYFQTVYIVNFFNSHKSIASVKIEYITNFTYIFMAVACLFAGWLSDRVERRKIYFVNLTLIIIFAFFMNDLIENVTNDSIILLQVLTTFVVGLYIGPEPILQAELYERKIRSTGLAISYNIATSIFGGMTPFIAEKMYIYTGSTYIFSAYIITMSFLALISLIFYKKQKI